MRRTPNNSTDTTCNENPQQSHIQQNIHTSNEQLNPMQYGFRPKVGTIESITAFKTILANRINSKQDTYICFIDFKKAFDRVEHDILIDILNKKAIPAIEIRIIKKIYENQIGFMKDDSEKQNPIDIKKRSETRMHSVTNPLQYIRRRNIQVDG